LSSGIIRTDAQCFINISLMGENMSLPEPTTRSPGKLVLVYSTSTGIQHLSGVRYLHDLTLPTDAEALADATALANVYKACIAPSMTITGYRVTDPLGATIIEGSFSPVIAGTGPTGGTLYLSQTITITGKGTAIVSGERVGQTRMVIYAASVVGITPGEKTLNIADYAWLLALKNHLVASTRYWADYYGQKAIARGLATIQFNAHTQRKYGS
jgi:hypothetical protein